MIPIDRIELNPRVCNGRPVIKGIDCRLSGIEEGRYTGSLALCQSIS